MKPSPYLNGISLQEFFPLLARLGQQIRMPVVALSLKTVGVGRGTDIGIIEFTAVTIGHGGNASQVNLKLAPGVNAAETRASEAGAALNFQSIYDTVSKAFATSLVIGFGTALYDVPVIYGQMVRYGLPIIAARNQIDLRDVWQKQVKAKGGLSNAAKHYGVESKASDALVAARVLEAMLWRHGSEAVLSELQCSLSSYLTPDQVIEAPDPVPPVTPDNQAGKSPRKGTWPRTGSKRTSPGSVSPPSSRQPAKNETLIATLKQAISKVVDRHGLVRPVHLQEIATAMNWNETKTSIVIGTLLTQGKINAKPFVIPEQQALLELHLPHVLKGMKEVKLKPIREAIQQNTGHDVEFIQIRLALKSLNVRLE